MRVAALQHYKKEQNNNSEEQEQHMQKNEPLFVEK